MRSQSLSNRVCVVYIGEYSIASLSALGTYCKHVYNEQTNRIGYATTRCQYEHRTCAEVWTPGYYKYQ